MSFCLHPCFVRAHPWLCCLPASPRSRGFRGIGQASSAHGLRRGRDSSLSAVSSPKRCSFGSHFSFLPVISPIPPMWQTIPAPPPTTASQIGALRLLTHSTKFCTWFVGRVGYTFVSSFSG